MTIDSRWRVLGYAPGQDPYRLRLLALGLTPGVTFRVQRVAPLGDPIVIELRGSCLSLRKHEAEVLKVERLV